MPHAARFLPAILPFALVVPGPLPAAESYDNCTGFVDTLPAVIETQGTWCLRHDLSTAIVEGMAITIATNNVTLDCNHFKIGGLAAGSGSGAYGVYASNRVNATVRNCSIRGFSQGLYLFGAGHVVEHNRFDNNLFRAIGVFGDGNRVAHNMVVDTGGRDGFPAATAIEASADVVDNTIENVFGDADLADTWSTGISIYRGRGHVVRGNNVTGLASSGTGHPQGLVNDEATATVFERNHVATAGFAAVGTGIEDLANAPVFCIGNTIYNFATALSGCDAVSGNLALP